MGHKFPKQEPAPEQEEPVVQEPVPAEPKVVAPVINFSKVKPEPLEPAKVDPGSAAPAVSKAGEMVNAAFDQAVVHEVATSEELQQELLEGAEQVVKNKVNAIKNEAEREDKAAHFNNKKGACECFGYNEQTTEKWAVNYMNAWHNVFTAIWITIGMVTFAPITFIGKKLKVIFKLTWVAMIVAVLIYAAAVLLPILFAFIKSSAGV